MAKASVLEKVLANIPQSGRTTKWESRVAPAHKKTIEDIRKAWLEGVFGDKIHPAAAAVAKTLREENIANVGKD